jgi:RNA polymerase sigma-70 factor (ECF subfamily)
MEIKLSALSDEELARGVWTTGDNDCFAELFTRYRKRVFYACRNFFSDVPAAEDATQETFLRAFRSIRGFQEGDFSRWLLRIAKNVCIDEWRRTRLETALDDPEIADKAVRTTIDATFETHQLAKQVWQEIRCLPSEQRQCLELKAEGFSYEETAARLGLTPNAVKSRIQNGRRMLWRKIEDALPRSPKG